MRDTLLPQYVNRENAEIYDIHQFPTNKADFDWYAKKSMTPIGYQTDADGNQILDDDGNPIEESNWGWGWGSINIDIVSTKQDEYDQIMDLYNKTERMGSVDEKINEIVTDVAGGYFAGDRTLDDTVSTIQNRVKLYVDESR